MSPTTWQRSVRDLAGAFGCAMTVTKKHIRLEHPDGWVVITSSTPSDVNALDNVRRDLRRKATGVWR